MLCKITNFLEDYRTEIIVFGLIGITFGGLILAIKQQEEAWQQFVVDHECVIVGRIASSTQTGYGYGLTSSGNYGYGVVFTTEPEKTVYDCNDGVRYTR
jgi:hypothetical protein